MPPLAPPLITPRNVMTWTWTKNVTDNGLMGSLQYLTTYRQYFKTVSPTSFCFLEKDDGTVDLGFVVLQTGAKMTQGDYLIAAGKLGFDLMPLIYEDRTNEGGLLPVLRRLFANPTPFFTSAINFVTQYKLKGFNVDFETEEWPTTQDHLELNMFLSSFAAIMQSMGKELTMDINNNFPIFNHTLLRQTGINKFLIMDTYTISLPLFVENVGFYLQHYEPDRMGMGFLSCGYGVRELELRLGVTAQLGISEVDIWAVPLPINWLPSFGRFLNSTI